MPAYPIITPGDAPVELSTDESSLSYSQLIATLNYIAYRVRGIYVQGETFAQVNQHYQYSQVRTMGALTILNKKGYIDTEQFLPVLNIEMGEDSDMILDNLSVLSFTILPLQTVQIAFDTRSVSPSYRLHGVNQDQGSTQATIAETLPDQPEEKKTNNKWIIAVAIITFLTGIYLVNEYRKKNT